MRALIAVLMSVSPLLVQASCWRGHEVVGASPATWRAVRTRGLSHAERTPRVLVVATGGTIAGMAAQPDSPNYDVGKVSVEAILAAVPDVASSIHIEGHQLMDPSSVTPSNPKGYVNVPSGFIRERHWLALARTVERALTVDHYDAVLITHGTDTMEETAFFLQMTVTSRKPVVLVGAMRPGEGANDPDGPDNLRAAVRIALDPHAAGKGIMIVQNFRVVPAFDALKVRTYPPNLNVPHEALPSPFEAPHYGDLATVHKQGDSFTAWDVDWNADHGLLTRDARALAIKFDVTGQTALPKVPVLYLNIGNDATDVIAHYLSTSPDVRGFVFAGAGNCGLTEDVLALVKAQVDRPELVFVRAARVGEIWCHHTYGMLPNSIGVGRLSPPHAKILLQLVQMQAARDGLSATLREYVKAYFAAHVPYPDR